eukprot:s3368_g5.t1
MCCPVGPLSVQRCCGGLTDPVQELPHVRQPEWGRLVHQAACGSIALAEQVSVPEVDAFSGTLPMDNHSPKSQCELRAVRILPTPSLSDYDRCLRQKMSTNTTHDWGIPAAELDAWLDCWCEGNMTEAINDIQCCSHRSFRQWCTVDCAPDCSSNLATECIQERQKSLIDEEPYRLMAYT